MTRGSTRFRLCRAAVGAALVVGAAVSGGCAGTSAERSQPAAGGGDTAGHEHSGSSPVTDDQFAAGEATTTASVTLQDYAFVGLPVNVTGPNVEVAATVVGGNEHELVVFDAEGKEVGAIAPFRTGPSRTMRLALEPGTYQVRCLVKEGARTHAELGMQATMRVTH